MPLKCTWGYYTNVIILPQIWLSLEDDTLWETCPPDYSQSISVAKNNFFEKFNSQNIPKGKVFQTNEDKDVMPQNKISFSIKISQASTS